MKDTTDDSMLVARAVSGEFAAFETLVDRYEDLLYRIAMSILRQREDAEDAVQTAFINAMKGLKKFRGDASFKTWIRRIAVNESLKILRKRKGLNTVSLNEATEENEEGVIKHPEYVAQWRDDPAKLIQESEVRKILRDAIDALPEKHRLVFILRDIDELSVKETAEALGIGESNVKVRLLRARLALREELTRIFGEEASASIAHDHEGDGFTPAEILQASYRQDAEGK